MKKTSPTSIHINSFCACACACVRTIFFALQDEFGLCIEAKSLHVHNMCWLHVIFSYTPLFIKPLSLCLYSAFRVSTSPLPTSFFHSRFVLFILNSPFILIILFMNYFNFSIHSYHCFSSCLHRYCIITIVFHVILSFLKVFFKNLSCR